MKTSPPDNIRIIALQWHMRTMRNIEELLTLIETQVKHAASYQCDIALLPEFFSLCLLDDATDPLKAIYTLASHSPRIIDACSLLAQNHHINIIAGSLPFVEDSKLYNVSTFCHRDGRTPHRQYKLHPTPYEKREWHMQGGEQLQAFDTDVGRIGILICYDIEFPELARLLAEQGMDLLCVPFWTDSQNAYHRVRYCAQARAIENECYVVLAGSFGTTPGNDVIDSQYAQSAIFTPSDLWFPEQAVLAEAAANLEMPVVADLEMKKLFRLRKFGSVQIGHDRRRDLFDIRWKGK